MYAFTCKFNEGLLAWSPKNLLMALLLATKKNSANHTNTFEKRFGCVWKTKNENYMLLMFTDELHWSILNRSTVAQDTNHGTFKIFVS